MGRTTKLHAPPGTDEANFGTERYRVDNDGIVYVPEEAAPDLIASGGFYTDPPALTVPDGMARLRGPHGASCSWAGEGFSADLGGLILVPIGAVAALAAHGFAPASETVVPAPSSGVQGNGHEQLPSPEGLDAPPPHEGLHATDVEALSGAAPTPGAVAQA